MASSTEGIEKLYEGVGNWKGEKACESPGWVTDIKPKVSGSGIPIGVKSII
jgi:hypothetical protein